MTRIDDEALDRHYLQITYELGLFMMEHLRRVYREFDGDIAMCMVLGEIAHHNARPFMRELLPRSRLDSRTLATDAVVDGSIRPSNALSIAEASGIPRETVRRKIDKLEKRGWISRDGKGGLRVTRKVGKQFREIDRQTLEGLLELGERVRALTGAR